MPSSLAFYYSPPAIYYAVSSIIGRRNASSQLKYFSCFLPSPWPNRLGTSGVEADTETGLRLSASHFSLKIWVVLQRIHLFSLRYDPVTDPAVAPPLLYSYSQMHPQLTGAGGGGGGDKGVHVCHIWALWFLTGEVLWGGRKRSEVVEFPHCFSLLLCSLAAALVIKLRGFDVPLEELASDGGGEEEGGGRGVVSLIQVGDDDRRQPLCRSMASERL